MIIEMAATVSGSVRDNLPDQAERESTAAAIRAKTPYIKDYIRMADMRCGKTVCSQGRNATEHASRFLHEVVEAARPGERETVGCVGLLFRNLDEHCSFNDRAGDRISSDDDSEAEEFRDLHIETDRKELDLDSDTGLQELFDSFEWNVQITREGLASWRSMPKYGSLDCPI